MNDYTPTTTQVREAASLDGPVAVEPDAFERWLAARDRETAARAWDEGAEAGYDDAEAGREEKRNPYREGDPT